MERMKPGSLPPPASPPASAKPTFDSYFWSRQHSTWEGVEHSPRCVALPRLELGRRSTEGPPPQPPAGPRTQQPQHEGTEARKDEAAWPLPSTPHPSPLETKEPSSLLSAPT